MRRQGPRTLVRFGIPDSDRIREDLLQLGLIDAAGAMTDGAEPVLAALGRAGRPELAVTSLARLADTAEDSASLLARLRDHSRFRGRLLAVLGGSTGLGDHLVAEPGDWHLLLAEHEPGSELLDLRTALDVLGAAVGIEPGAPLCTGTEGAKATVTKGKAVAALRRAYRSQLLVIAAHDLAHSVETSLPAPALPDVCRALSALADAMLQVGLSVAAAEVYPAAPVRLGVVAMGKTGARELNYLSDVDVIFVADHPPLPDDPAEAEALLERRDETRMLATGSALASGMMRICGQAAWEVDAALRPEGKAGALVRTPASHAAYYTKWAHTWEFQALLKARPAAGDPELGQKFLEITQPGVWSAARRESFVDDVQAMRRRVEKNIPDQDRDRELKLGVGGLRDVEFAVQLLQLVHGRTDPELRVGGTLTALRALVRGGYVGRTDGAEMASAYTFLRRAEHRLQLQRLRRTHLLPDDESELEWLARTDGYLSTGTASAADVFTTDRLRHVAQVRRLHEKLFYRPLLHAVAAVPGDELQLSPEAAKDRLAALGFFNPDAALRHLAALTSGVSRRAAIQRTLLPVLLDTFAGCPDPDAGLLSYRTVSEALAETPWYLRLLRDEGQVAQRLARLLGGSKLIGDLLTRAPEVLRLLADTKALVEQDPATVRASLLARAARADSAQDAVDRARSARRHELARLACADLLRKLDVEDIIAALTSVAEASVQAALKAAQDQVVAERGGLRFRMAVIGMGRFGGGELGYGSDADVIYVAEPVGDVDPSVALDDANATADLLARLLARPSPDPALKVDADLRPEGRNGRLVRTLHAYQQYWEKFAAPWERQAMLRARFVAGDEELAREFMAAADWFRYPAEGLATKDVLEIRRIKARVDTERMPRGADPTTNTKLGRGGLSDIEWTVQLLQLRHAGEVPSLRTPHTLEALAAAAEAGLISDDDARDLRDGWLAATKVRNTLMLVSGKPADQIPTQGRPLAGVARAMGFPPDEDPGEFVDRYRRAARHSRMVVDRLFDGG